MERHFGTTQSTSRFLEFSNCNKLSSRVDGNQISFFTKVQQLPIHSNSGKRQNRSLTNPLVGNSPTCLQNLSYYFSQYCRFAGIHGIQYVGERGRFMIEKFMWSIVLTIVCSLCLYLISKTYNRWVTSPVTVSFATAEVPIWEIPFPAVTICPDVKPNPEIFNYSNVLWKKYFQVNTTAEEERYFENFRVVCNDGLFSELTGDTGRLFIDQSELLTDLSAVRLKYVDLCEIQCNLSVMLIPCAEIRTSLCANASSSFTHSNLTSAKWLLKKLKWEDAFSLSLTSAGFCYSFNTLHQDEIFKYVNIRDKSSNTSKARKWSLEHGYPNDNSDSFPRRTFMSGISGGLDVTGLFANSSHYDLICTNFLDGFKVVLHHPSEMPDMDKHFRVPFNAIVFVGIIPRMTRMSEELISYRPEDRKCYLADERPLKFFKSYTQQNCIQDCFFNYTLLKCGCVPFYIPHDNATATCGIGSKGCMEDCKLKYLSKESTCNCFSCCTSLEYNVEVSLSDWIWWYYYQIFEWLNSNDAIDETEGYDLSKLVVFYKELQFLPSERHELYGYVDFFSNVGGLLGLFVGFSVTTFIEIVYFLSLRLVCNIKKFGRKFWSGDPELINDDGNHSRRKIVRKNCDDR